MHLLRPACSFKHSHAHHFECSTGWLWFFLVQDYGPEVVHISTWVDSNHFHSRWIWQLDTWVNFQTWKPKPGNFGGTFLEVLDLQQGTLPVSCWISLGVSLLVSDSRLCSKFSFELFLVGKSSQETIGIVQIEHKPTQSALGSSPSNRIIYLTTQLQWLLQLSKMSHNVSWCFRMFHHV